VQCRDWTSDFFTNIGVARDSLEVHGGERVAWWRSSEKVRRRSRASCRSTLFFDPVDTRKHGWIGLPMGALDTATGAKMRVHAFTEQKGDYHEVE
jgi:hypothetical protein